MKKLDQSRSGYYKSIGAKRMRSKNYDRKEDEGIFLKIKKIVEVRPSYGYKRVTVLVNREFGTRYNKKRIYRIMRIKKLLLPKNKNEGSRGSHTGKVMVLHPNIRWSSDCFEIKCWNGEKVYVIFALDYCDREIISYHCSKKYITTDEVKALMAAAVNKRFKSKRTPREIQWLSDRGPIYRSEETQSRARQLGLKPCFTAAYSPSSNGMSEAFVGTMKRDYVYTNDCADAETTLSLLPAWFEDYNEKAPHSALAMKARAEYRRELQLAGVST